MKKTFFKDVNEFYAGSGEFEVLQFLRNLNESKSCKNSAKISPVKISLLS